MISQSKNLGVETTHNQLLPWQSLSPLFCLYTHFFIVMKPICSLCVCVCLTFVLMVYFTTEEVFCLKEHIIGNSREMPISGG